MGKKGPNRHLKRQQAPRFWPIHRKEHVWAVRTSPGPHAIRASIPLLVMVREMLGYGRTGKEARMLIKQGKILIDGVPRRDEGYPVGVMDVVELPDSKQLFRVFPTHGGKLLLHLIEGDESSFKLCCIVGKRTVKEGREQLNLHDGRNIIPTDGEYGLNDVLQLSIPEQEVLNHVSFKEGISAAVIGGRSQGRHGILIELGSEPGRKRTATIRTSGGEDIRTLASYVFALGEGEPLISLPGE